MRKAGVQAHAMKKKTKALLAIGAGMILLLWLYFPGSADSDLVNPQSLNVVAKRVVLNSSAATLRNRHAMLNIIDLAFDDKGNLATVINDGKQLVIYNEAGEQVKTITPDLQSQEGYSRIYEADLKSFRRKPISSDGKIKAINNIFYSRAMDIYLVNIANAGWRGIADDGTLVDYDNVIEDQSQLGCIYYVQDKNRRYFNMSGNLIPKPTQAHYFPDSNGTYIEFKNHEIHKYRAMLTPIVSKILPSFLEHRLSDELLPFFDIPLWRKSNPIYFENEWQSWMLGYDSRHNIYFALVERIDEFLSRPRYIVQINSAGSITGMSAIPTDFHLWEETPEPAYWNDKISAVRKSLVRPDWAYHLNCDGIVYIYFKRNYMSNQEIDRLLQSGEYYYKVSFEN